MFPKVKIPISAQIYIYYRPFIWFFRSLLLFPVIIQRNGINTFLVISPFLILTGFVYGIVTIFVAYRGIFLDIGINKNDSIRVTTDVDKVMYLNDVTCYGLVFICGLFINPSKILSFFTYIRCLNRVDSIIKTKFKKLDQYILVLIFLAILSLNAFLFYIDFRDDYTFFGDKIGLSGVLERYLGIDIIACTANIIEYINKILMNGLEKRIKRLNELLDIEYVTARKKFKTITRRVIRQNRDRSADSILKQCQAYQALMDAANALNDFLSVCTVIMVLAVTWGLIESSYFLLTAIAGKRGELRDDIEIPEFVASFSFHVLRFLLITEPAYSCVVEIEATKRCACRLMTCNVSRLYNKQAKRLAVMLGLRQLEFSGSSFFVVDRALFTALLDTIVTLLVILLQYRDDFKLEF